MVSATYQLVQDLFHQQYGTPDLSFRALEIVDWQRWASPRENHRETLASVDVSQCFRDLKILMKAWAWYGEKWI